jgi:hypothetical protein
MKKLIFIGLFVAFGTLMSFTAHKFYVSIYQIDYAPEKKMLQITARIFIDDLNEALLKKYKQKTFLGEKNESDADIALMKKYVLEDFSLKVNGQPKTINYLSREFENNVIICYFNVKDATKIKTMEIRNKTLFEFFPDQQNIIQANVFGHKQNLLLTADNPGGVLKWD